MTRRLPASVLASVLAIVALGCREASPPAPATKDPAKAQGHEHTALHGGVLVELGEEAAHLELVLDRASGALTAFVLDGEAERAIKIAQPALRLRLTAPEARTIELSGRTNALTGERSGDTSEFTVTDAALKTSAAVTGAIVELTVRGMRFTEVEFALQP